jgi:hypothetical protein
MTQKNQRHGCKTVSPLRWFSSFGFSFIPYPIRIIASVISFLNLGAT